MLSFYNQMSLRHRAIIALILVNVLWGFSFPIMKCLNLQMDSHFGVTEHTASHAFRTASAAWMIGLRFGVALIMFVMVFPKILRRIRMPEALAGVAIGAFFFLGLLLQVMGLATIPASRSGFLTSLVVIVTPLFSTVIKRKLPRHIVLVGAAVALLGVTVLTGMIEFRDMRVLIAEDAIAKWQWGDTLTLLGTLFFSIQILLLDSLGKRLDSVLFTPTMFATTSLLAWVVFFLFQRSTPEVAESGWIGLVVQPRFYILVGLLCLSSLLAFSLMNQFQPMVSASQAAVIYTLEPLCASCWAMFIPAILSAACGVIYANEQLTLPLLTGGCLVLAANGLAVWPDRQGPRVRSAVRR